MNNKWCEGKYSRNINQVYTKENSLRLQLVRTEKSLANFDTLSIWLLQIWYRYFIRDILWAPEHAFTFKILNHLKRLGGSVMIRVVRLTLMYFNPPLTNLFCNTVKNHRDPLLTIGLWWFILPYGKVVGLVRQCFVKMI